MFKKRLIPALLFSMLAGVTASSHATQFSGVFVFGDSLSDAGIYRPALIAAGVPASLVSQLGRFTTNPGPVWSELVSQYYGYTPVPSNVAGGNIFAQGGARVASDSVSTPAGFPQRPVSTQVTEYLTSTHGVADPNALYSIWAVGNDFLDNFNAIAGGQINPTTFINATAGSEIQQIGRLAAAGARYILVFAQYDGGATPRFQALGPAVSGQVTQLTVGYNTALFAGLQQAGIRAIPVDTFTLLNEVRANASAYGFTNTTGTACGPFPPFSSSSNAQFCLVGQNVPANGQNTYMFADGIHPTSATHAIIANFVESLLDGPQQLSLLAEMPLHTREGHIRTLDAGLQTAMHGETGKITAFAAADGGNFDINAVTGNPAIDTKNRNVTVGVTMRASDTFTLGLGVGKSTSDATFGNGLGGFKTDETVLSLFGGMKSEGFYANGSVSIADVSYDDINRNIVLGQVTRTASSSSAGSNASGSIALGYDFELAKCSVGPFLAFTAQNVDVNGFTEDGAGSANLKIGAQKRISRVVSGGLRASMDFGKFTPFARVSLDQEQKNDDREVFATPTSMATGNTYGIPAFKGDSRWGTATFGVRARLAERIGLSVVYSGVFSRQDVKQDALTANLTYRF
jgi:outer membrane lipase/esterase